MVKIATYNLNNLFERAKIMELEGFSKVTKEVLNDVKKLNELLDKESYAGKTGTDITTILNKYFTSLKNGKRTKTENEWFKVNEIREKLFSISKDGSGIKLKAKDKNDWYGWIELLKEKTNGDSVLNTARVLNAIKADIICTVEVDNRIALKNFSELMKNNFKFSYENSMLIDGNDERGIDVGVLSNFEIGSVVSHINDYYLDGNKRKQNIFSRDCPEYEIKLSKNKSLFLLCNHFKSKGYGDPASNDRKRKLQADEVVKILSKYNLSKDYVVVAGDFNDTPDSQPLKNLLSVKGIYDVLNHKSFKGDRWTYHTGKEQIDFLLVSEPLFKSINEVNIERRGIFKKGNVSFKEVTSKVNQASDHACVWVSFDLK